jgi:hypothetical protein
LSAGARPSGGRGTRLQYDPISRIVLIKALLIKMNLTRARVHTIRDARGMLRIFEKGASLPFALKRCFVISNVPKGKARGEHAVSCNLFLAVITGTCRLTARSTVGEERLLLSHRTKGVVVKKGTWLRLDRFSSGAVVLVCASENFRRTSYFWQQGTADGGT